MSTVLTEVGRKADEVRAACRLVIERWAERGVQAAYLYGSVLGPRFREDSDIDLAVLDEPSNRLSFARQSLLMDELERVLRTPVDLRMLRDCSLSHQAHVVAEGLLVWCKDRSLVDTFSQDVTARSRSCRADNDKALSKVLKALDSGVAKRNESRLPS